MPAPENIAKSFRELDFHDDTFVDLRVLPSQVCGEGAPSVVEIQLLQHSGKKVRHIRFSGCANLRVAMDFDVLAQNLPSNTSRLEAHTNLNQIRDFIHSQKKDWDIAYASGVESPLNKKLLAMNDFVAFRVQFFGGAVDVLARNYQVETADHPVRHPTC
jgi:hypothetical protein